MSVTIRQARWDEHPAVQRLAKRCGKFVRTFGDVRDIQAAYAAGQVWIAIGDDDDDGSLLGFAYAALLKREPDVASLYELGTVPEARGRRIGTDLMKRATGGRAIRLVVDADNESAVIYYLHRGLSLMAPHPVPTRAGKARVWRLEGNLI